jgi:hypothetical protein
MLSSGAECTLNKKRLENRKETLWEWQQRGGEEMIAER